MNPLPSGTFPGTSHVSCVDVRLPGVYGPRPSTLDPMPTQPITTDAAVNPVPVSVVVSPTTTGDGIGSRTSVEAAAAESAAGSAGPRDGKVGVTDALASGGTSARAP